MAVVITGRVGPSSTGDGEEADARTDKSGALVTVPLHGQHYEAAARGSAFYATNPATGIALIVPATTGNHPTLWNPEGSGVNVSIIKLELGYVSGNNAPTSLEWAVVKNTGSTVATGAPIATFTDVASEPCLVGSGASAKARWAPAVNTYTVAPVISRTAGLSLFTGVAATAVAPFPLKADYDGDFVLSPGVSASLCSVGATTTSVFVVTVTWEEIPV